jgi:uncharacterized protein YjbI with pentapeptide repeats
MAVRIIDDPLYQLLRNEKVEEFNKQRSSVSTLDFTNCDFRGLDLRKLNAAGIDFSGAYFRGADLRGVDFSQSILKGASLAGAQISGCLFPVELSAAEIELSVSRGTRMRYKS